MAEPRSKSYPTLRTAGVDGFLVTFAESITEDANRAALSFRAAVDQAKWVCVAETSSTLVSVFVRFDPVQFDHKMLQSKLEHLLHARDWYATDLPMDRRRWRVPTVFGTDLAPQLSVAARAAGMDDAAAIASMSETPVVVQTIGFAPGQPYLGQLSKAWDIPRNTQLSDPVPPGALVVAIRQLVLFSVSAPTGWLHIGQTALKLFQPETKTPFLLRPGDEVTFTPTQPDALAALADDPTGGATFERIP